MAVYSRDLQADLAICGATTPGPYEVRLCDCGCNQIYIDKQGKLTNEDVKFFTEARTGWPYAIRRALAAEAEIDRLQNELAILQEQLEQRCYRA